MDFFTIEHWAWCMGVGRMMIGLAPFVAAGPASRWLGFPTAHDNASARLMARLFGVRDVGLGVLTIWAAHDFHTLKMVALFQACHDGGDLVSAAVPLVRREGIDRGALRTGAFALGGASLWLVLFAVLSRRG